MSFQSLQDSYPGQVATPMNLKHNAYIVPTDKSFGFSSLTHATPYNSTTYFGIQNAYSTTPNCTSFGYRACSGDTIQASPIIYADGILRSA